MSTEKKKDKFPKIQGSKIGYETTNKEDFDSQVEITFDYSNIDSTSRSVKKALSDFTYNMHQETKRIGKNYGNRGDINASAIAKLSNQSTSIQFELVPNGLRIQQALKPVVSKIGEDGKKIMTNFINRVDTGRMKSSIRYNTRGRSNKYVINIGWTELWYKYFGFQENGTKKINPMQSVIRTKLAMEPRLQNFMSRFIRSYKMDDGSFNGAEKVDY